MSSFFSCGDWFTIFIVRLSNVGISKPGPWQYCTHRDKSLVFPFQGVPPSAQHSLSPLPHLTKWTCPVFHTSGSVFCSIIWLSIFFYFDVRCSWEQVKHTTELLFWFCISMEIINSSAQSSGEWWETYSEWKVPASLRSLWTRWLFFALKHDHRGTQWRSLYSDDLKVIHVQYAFL